MGVCVCLPKPNPNIIKKATKEINDQSSKKEDLPNENNNINNNNTNDKLCSKKQSLKKVKQTAKYTITINDLSNTNDNSTFNFNRTADISNILIEDEEEKSAEMEMKEKTVKGLTRKKNKVFTKQVALVGASGVGKTSLLIKDLDNRFEPYHIPTLSYEQRSKRFIDQNKEIHINFFDLSGDFNYQTDYNDIFKRSNIILLMFDLTEPKSFNYIEEQYLKIKRNNKDAKFILIGNKSDLKITKMNRDIGDNWKSTNKNVVDYLEISVKECKNINNLFKCILNNLN